MTLRSTVKYLFDRIFAFLAILVCIPLFVGIALIIIIRSGFPVIFHQKRAGMNGKEFTIFKFRTMVINDGRNTISTRNDSRIMKEGAILRRWKLDELPELFNVLMGDMSFVGPRPDMPEYAKKLKGEERLILSLRPGITGPATLKYIDEEEILARVPDPVDYNDRVIYPDKVRINLEYVKRYSLLEDLKMIFYTVIRKKPNEY